MGLAARLFERRQLTAEQWLLKALSGGRETASGRSVDAQEALSSVAVLACVRVLAESCGMLPLHVYQRLEPRGRERAAQHPLDRLLGARPNPEMTAVEYREAMVGHLATWGNHYSEIQRDRAERVTALWPLRPDRMQVERTGPADERSLVPPLVYVYTLPTGERRRLDRRSVWHIRGLSSDGILGYSPVTLAREAIGLTLATEEYGARYFGSGARPGGVLERPADLEPLSDAARKRLAAEWAELHEGLTRSQRIAILEEGVTFKAIGLPPEDSQFLETRKFQRTEIAALFRVPPHMIADLERATFSNIEMQAIEFVTFSLMPWLTRIEQRADVDLIGLDSLYYAKHAVQGLLRGDTPARMTAYGQGIQNGIYSPNDVRELEDLNPVEGGDRYFINGAMVPIDQAGQQPAGAGAAA